MTRFIRAINWGSCFDTFVGIADTGEDITTVSSCGGFLLPSKIAVGGSVTKFFLADTFSICTAAVHSVAEFIFGNSRSWKLEIITLSAWSFVNWISTFG